MIEQDRDNQVEKPDSGADTSADDTASEGTHRPKEIGGRKGPDPTRYGDWEKAGRCIDF